MKLINGIVNYGTDLVVLGMALGAQTTDSISTYLLLAENGKFKWEKMKPEHKIGSGDCLAMTVSDRLVGEDMPCHCFNK